MELTENENLVFVEIKKYLNRFGQDGFSDLNAEKLAEISNLDINSAKGFMGSLYVKNLIRLEVVGVNSIQNTFIHLN